MTPEGDFVKFTSFKSQVDPSFWQRLTEVKIDVDKLDENVHKIWGFYSNKKPEGQNQLFSVDASSFNKIPDENRIYGVGSIINKNTIESFKDENKLELLKEQGTELMKMIKEDAIERPSLLSRFLIFSYANLKSYQYYYWFAFPAPTFLSCKYNNTCQNIKEVLTDAQINVLCESFDKNLDYDNKGFFLVRLDNDILEIFTLKEGLTKMNGNWFLVFCDTSDSKYPSWPLRNFIAFIAYHRPDIIKKLKVICLRLFFSEGRWKGDNSIVLDLSVCLDEDAWVKAECGESWIGWEKNEKGKMGPRLANLKSYMDPVSLAESSVDLNIKLMKWQILPDLNLDIIKLSKCLLIGAGTLGCAVARNLMCWGVRNITFIDYGTVSFSNPVRQYLYKFADTGKPKAEVAAAALKEIFPGVVSSGFVFSIPMPGHPVGGSLLQETKENVAKLERLIEDHDVIFLLMDSRESRWLPTLIAAAKQKLVINAALGFDSYLVMRHGIKTNLDNSLKNENLNSLSGDKLGCYFCSDVTAPGNTFRGRTLDQQCTVTRPGVSNMAAALAVELFVSVLQHPLLGLAPPESNPDSSKSSSLLGIVPHSVRGFISHYQTILPAVENYSSCVACSQKPIEKPEVVLFVHPVTNNDVIGFLMRNHMVIDTYKQEGFDFILKCLESKEFLEELCGLTALQNETLLADILVYSDSEPELDGDGEN